MNRTPAIVLALLLLATGTVVAVLFVRQQNLPTDAQAALNEYIRYRQEVLSPHTLSIRQVAFAGYPSHFGAEMSGVSYGSSQFYRTTYSYPHTDSMVSFSNAPTIPTAADTLSLSNSIKFTAFPTNGSHPIPFPPLEVWCVVLKEAASPATIVFVALHQDLYNADWLVHEPPAYANIGEFNGRLATIGCNLDLGQAQ